MTNQCYLTDSDQCYLTDSDVSPDRAATRGGAGDRGRTLLKSPPPPMTDWDLMILGGDRRAFWDQGIRGLGEGIRGGEAGAMMTGQNLKRFRPLA